MSKHPQLQVLFVCLGNVCRSPMAEAVLRHLVEEQGLSEQILVDSVGTGAWHIGEPPHQGTRQQLDLHGVSWQGLRGRKIGREDLDRFDYIIGMDEENLSDLRAMAREEQQEKLFLLSEFVEDADWTGVPDPWFTRNFDLTYRLVEQGCRALLERLTGELS